MNKNRPMMGFFPIGGLFILPLLMFGGWIAVAVLGGILSLVAAVIGEGLGILEEGVFSGSGLVIGIAIGLAAFRYFRNRKKEEAARQEDIGMADGIEAERVMGPEKAYRTNF